LPNHPSSSIRLEHLIALSDEMAALVRAGVPLERGLANFGHDVPGELGRLARHLAARLESGDSLSEVLTRDRAAFPQVYRTVVDAGLKSGRLAAALGGLATCARRLADLRRSVALVMLYPLAIVLLAFGLLVVFVTQLAPQYQQAYESLRLQRDALLDVLVAAGETAYLWGTLVPLAVLAIAVAWWWSSGRALLVESTPWTLAVGWIPGVGKLLIESRTALFSELLALLIEHEVPLPEALRLAGAATGDRRTAEATQSMAAAIERGEPLAANVPVCTPIMAWLAALPRGEPLLASFARQTSEHYAWRARFRLDQIRLVLPILATVCVSGVVALCYALTLFIPWSHLLEQLG
jgi:general secretion pathway protein F